MRSPEKLAAAVPVAVRRVPSDPFSPPLAPVAKQPAAAAAATPLRPSPVRPNTAHAAADAETSAWSNLARPPRPAACAVPTPSPVAAPAAGFTGYSEERTQPGWRAVSDGGGVRAVSEIIDAPPTQLNPLDLFSPTLPPPRPHAAIATPSPMQPAPAAAAAALSEAAPAAAPASAPRTADSDASTAATADRVSEETPVWLRQAESEIAATAPPPAVASPSSAFAQPAAASPAAAEPAFTSLAPSAPAGPAPPPVAVPLTPSGVPPTPPPSFSTNKMEMAQPDSAASISLSPLVSLAAAAEPAATDATPVDTEWRHSSMVDENVPPNDLPPPTPRAAPPVATPAPVRAAAASAAATAISAAAGQRTPGKALAKEPTLGTVLEAGGPPATSEENDTFGGLGGLGGLPGGRDNGSGSPAWCGESGGSPREPAWHGSLAAASTPGRRQLQAAGLLPASASPPAQEAGLLSSLALAPEGRAPRPWRG